MQLVLSRLAAGVALAMLASSSFAADAPANASKPTSTQTAAEQQQAKAAEAAALSESSEGLVETRKADGTISVDLQGRFQSTVTAAVGADGTVSIACGDAGHGGAHNHNADGSAVPATPARDDR